MMLGPFILLLCAATAWGIGCNVDKPVGVELGLIQNAAMTSNSEYNKWHKAPQGRLNNYKGKLGGAGAWCANKNDNTANRYLQIDLGTTRKIGRIGTQGRNTTYAQYVKNYKITYSIGGVIFVGISVLLQEKLFTGNSDKNTIVYNDLPSANRKPIEARYIRILPVEFYGNICMRVEFYECVEPTTAAPTTKAPSPPSCPIGYVLGADGKTCEDVNECEANTHQCDQLCHNTNGSYTCSCKAGYILQADGKTCNNINECQEIAHGCTQLCIDNEGGFSCGCNKGYKLKMDNKTCEDVDECALNICTQRCNNTEGSYTCSCDSGYRLQADGKTCNDINECTEDTDGCSQLCVNTAGSFRCDCKDGYSLQNDAKTCVDINECAIHTDQCNNLTTTCQNSDGSYSCPCLPGYEKGSDIHTCNDIDECTKGTDQCVTYSTYCTNSPGSYKCNCRQGFEEDPNSQYKCNDINECLVNNGGCSDNCTNLDASYICTCPSGYKLDSSGKNCVDRNECELANGGCQHTCTNTDGSYTCSCKNGFKLNPNGLTCEDIDECDDGTAQCDPQSTNCNNLIPSYECNCKSGYVPIQSNIYKCQAKTCAALIESLGTMVSPSSCLEDQKSVVGDVCTFSCKAGYELPSNANTLGCLSSGSWNASIISCQKISCPKLDAPTDGNVLPTTCKTVGNIYNETCYYTCLSGYKLSGIMKKTCQSNGQWNSQEEPTCQIVYPDPWITCPDNVIVALSPGANTADVSVLLGSPSSNQPAERISITPVQYNANKIFPAGTTTLTYTATNLNGKTAECKAAVFVKDAEKPTTSNCPLNIYETTTEATKAVSWTPPTFTDNVGVTRLTSSKNPGDTFDQGSTTVTYVASDLENNAETCSFTVNVKKLQCDPNPAFPDNGNLSCSNFGGTHFCTPSCYANKKLFKNAWFIQCSSVTNLEWGEIPDCVDYTSPGADDSCPSPYVKQGSIGGATVENICVKCPKGTHYDTVTATCKNCPVSYISTAEGSLQCVACPANSSTLLEGSKKCTAQCYAGQFSNSGFDLPANLEPCEPCPRSSFQGSAGQRSCEKCPNGTTTISTGSSSSADCGGPPVVSSFEPNPNNASENQATKFECEGHGLPLPSFTITKVVPVQAGFGGPVTYEYLTGPDGSQIGLRYVNTKVSEHDKGAYKCTVTNQFGTDEKYLFVNVALDFSIGKRRRRRRRRSSVSLE